MRRKRVLLVSAFVLLAVAVVVYANRTTVIVRRDNVKYETAPCTAPDIEVCQQVALGHLSDALRAYPHAHQYTVRWSAKWLFSDAQDYDDFEIIYDRRTHDLTENNVGNATMDYYDHVTDRAIHEAVRVPGGFKALGRYGGEDHQP